MKTAEVKNSTSATNSSKPFFNKSGEGTFFAQKQETDAPFFQAMLIQPALAIGAPNDPFEQEADKVGRQVMDNFGQASTIQTKLSSLGVQASIIQPMYIGTRISRMVQHRQKMAQAKCNNCKEKEMMAQPKLMGIQFAGEGGMVSSNIEQRINSQRGGGSSMDTQTKGAMESSFGADFNNVNIHTGTPAVQMSQELNAHAFTVGSDIFFNKGKYQPQTKEGSGLLAHELTHTVQQGAAVQNKRINRRPLSQMLSMHEMAHLSTMNSNTLSRKEMAQLEKIPEEEMMQQKEIFESKEVDKVQKKDGGLSLRRCGGGSKPAMKEKQVTLNITKLHGSTRSTTSDISFANTNVFGQAKVKIVKGKEETLNEAESKALIGADLILDDYLDPSKPTNEEKKLFATNQKAGEVSIFYVKNLKGTGFTGESFWSSLGLGFTGSVVGNRAVSQTLSHELGHVLLDTGGHESGNDNLLHPVNINSRTKLKSGQITKIRSSPFAK